MERKPTSDPLSTPDQVGQALAITGRSVLNLEARGVITAAVRVGKIVRFDLAQVKAQLAAATEASVQAKKKARGQEP